MRGSNGLTALLVLTVLATRLAAQEQPMAGGGGDAEDPEIFMDEPGSVVHTQYPYIQFHFCDNTSLNASSRWIKVNSVTVTSSFDWEYSGVGCGGTPRGLVYSNTVALSLGSNTIEAHICDNAGNCSTESWNVTRYQGPPPVISLTPFSSDIRDYSRCAVSCFAATYAQSTVPYFSLDTPRNVTLAYNSDQVSSRPFVHVDVTPGDPANVPSYYYFRVRYGSTDLTFLNDTNVLRFTPQGSAAVRLGGQLKPNQINAGATGSYPITIFVGAQYSTDFVETSVSARVTIVNQDMLAEGWNVGGLQRAVVQSDGILVTEGDGSATWFLKSGSVYITPTGDFSTLAAISGGVYRRSYPDSTKVDFDSLGHMTRLRGAWPADSTMFVYDSLHRLTAIKDPTHIDSVPRQITLTYGTYGLSSIQDPFSRTTSITVNSSKLLTAIADPGGGATTFTYDSLRLWKVTDRNGIVAMRWTYDTLHPSSTVIQLRGPQFRAASGNLQYPTVDLTPWQRRGVPYVATTSPASAFAALLVDSIRAVVTDPGNHVTRFTVNRFGQPLRTTDPVGNVSVVTYTSAGLVDSVVDPLGVNSGFDYNGSGGVTRAMAGGLTTNFRYAPAFGQVDSIWGDGIPGQRDSIGANGRLLWRRTGGVLSAWNTQYDNYGRVSSAFDAEGHEVVHTWYAGTNGNRSRDSLSGGRDRRYFYDQYGRAVADSTVGFPKDSTVYDLLNRVRETRRASLATVFAYDSLRLIQVTDPKSQVYSFLYNSAGHLIRRTDPLGRSDSMQYSGEGLHRRTTNRRGQTFTITYDSLHRATDRSGTGFTTAGFNYSSRDTIVSTWNANARVRTYVNAVNRRVDSVVTYLKRSPTDSLKFVHRYSYRSNGLLDSVRASGDSVTFVTRRFGYHATRVMLDTIKLGAAVTRFLRNDDGQQTGILLPGSDTISNEYIPGHSRAQSVSNILWDAHHYDGRGRMNQHLMGTVMRQFSFDSHGRLATASIANSPDSVCTSYDEAGWDCYVPYDSIQTYSYDQVGNRTGVTAYPWEGSQLWSQSGSCTTGNRIASFADCSYVTDSLTGEVRQRSCNGDTLNLVWNADGQLDSIKIVGGDATRFFYDAQGRLVRRVVNGTTTALYLWEGSNLFAELAANGNRQMEYSYYGTDQLHAVINGVSASQYYAHSDAVGNVRGFTDASGYTFQKYEFDAFGQLTGIQTPNALPLNRARWKGALWMSEDADLYYMRNRWYEPRSGRFLSEDPEGIAAGLNQYTFAGSEPINRADPMGTEWVYVCRWINEQPEPLTVRSTKVCGWEWIDGISQGQAFSCESGSDWIGGERGECSRGLNGQTPEWHIVEEAMIAVGRCKGQIASFAVGATFDYFTAGQAANIQRLAITAARSRRIARIFQRRGDLSAARAFNAAGAGASQDLALAAAERGQVRGTNAAASLAAGGIDFETALGLASGFVPYPGAGTVANGAMMLSCLAGR